LARRRRGIAGRADRAEVAQADRVAQLRQERRGVALAQPARTLAQLLFDAPRVRNERLVALAQRRDLGFDALEQLLLGVAPGDALGVGLAHARGFLGTGEGLEDLEQRRALDRLRLARLARIGDDREHQLAQLLRRREQRDGVVVALAHLAAVEARQCGDLLFDRRFRQHEVLPSGRL